MTRQCPAWRVVGSFRQQIASPGCGSQETTVASFREACAVCISAETKILTRRQNENHGEPRRLSAAAAAGEAMWAPAAGAGTGPPWRSVVLDLPPCRKLRGVAGGRRLSGRFARYRIAADAITLRQG